jgi:leucyl/phenylalanyl-tRNA--protein transferase
MHPDLQPEPLLTAYATGIFPMADEDGEIYWFSPDPRAVIDLDRFHVPRTLRQVYRRRPFALVVDQDFEAVIRGCADRPEGTWISEDIVEAYCRLHRLGVAHSVEARQGPELVGGLYGVALRGAFFGESMFHTESEASKIALVYLVERMIARGYQLLDVQFLTPHLQRFGAVEISRKEYLERLEAALCARCTFVDRPATPSQGV